MLGNAESLRLPGVLLSHGGRDKRIEWDSLRTCMGCCKSGDVRPEGEERAMTYARAAQPTDLHLCAQPH